MHVLSNNLPLQVNFVAVLLFEEFSAYMQLNLCDQCINLVRFIINQAN